MAKLKFGIIREGKVPPDRRVPLSPAQCSDIIKKYPDIEIAVQKSDIRIFSDQEYASQGIKLQDDMHDCDILLGVKEVPVEQLIENKTYMFFSHTIKLQPYNSKLLQTVLDRNIRLIDYEVITDTKGKRLIGFGRYAGIVGCYNGFLALGKKLGSFELKAAHLFKSVKEMDAELEKVKLPDNFKIVLTGYGRVAGGALEVIEKLKLCKVCPEDFLNKEFNEPVYTRLKSRDFYKPRGDLKWARHDFYQNPQKYQSNFSKYTKVADFYVACHYWNPKADFILSREDIKKKDFKIKVIADISCDINGPIASTIRPSTIENPLYGYDPATGNETDFNAPDAIGVMAVDNLPCELPADASEDFGGEFINYVLPNLIGPDHDKVIERATIAEKGQLCKDYKYLEQML